MVNMMETRLPVPDVSSLVWDGNCLVNWAAGGTRYGLDGEITTNYTPFGRSFDGAMSSPSGEYTVIYTRLGTKGLVMRNGKLLREINRSYYFAESYEYPVCMVRLKNGREAIIHCPEEFNRLEIDDLETGERLTASQARKLPDFFHSRLACSPDGTALVSAGWLWHPLDEVRAYDIGSALEDAAQLDDFGLNTSAWADESSAVFLRDGRLAVALASTEYGEDKAGEDTEFLSIELCVFDLRDGTAAPKVTLANRAGTMMAVGAQHLLTLHEYPRLINIVTGCEEHSWPHIASGLQTSSIISAAPPPIALDHAGQRCAIADATGITILQF